MDVVSNGLTAGGSQCSVLGILVQGCSWQLECCACLGLHSMIGVHRVMSPLMIGKDRVAFRSLCRQESEMTMLLSPMTELADGETREETRDQ
jgi:hypothetical protein